HRRGRDGASGHGDPALAHRRGADRDDAGRRAAPEDLLMDVLWITAGLGCDGDTIAMTAATNPSIEDLVLGGIPGVPAITLHNPCLAYANGDEYMRIFHRAAAGEVDPFILVIEGSIPDEKNKQEGC